MYVDCMVVTRQPGECNELFNPDKHTHAPSVSLYNSHAHAYAGRGGTRCAVALDTMPVSPGTGGSGQLGAPSEPTT